MLVSTISNAFWAFAVWLKSYRKQRALAWADQAWTYAQEIGEVKTA